jgi:hypothetical protein
MFCLQQAFKLLGFELDEDKSQPPSEVTHVLGVAFNTQALIEERILRVEPKPLRVRNFVATVDAILHRNLPAWPPAYWANSGFFAVPSSGNWGDSAQALYARGSMPREIPMTSPPSFNCPCN